MVDDEAPEEYACPECDATVEPDWAACPNCGVEFSAPGEDKAPAASAAPETSSQAPPDAAGGEDELGTELDELEREIEAATPPEVAEEPEGAAPPEPEAKMERAESPGWKAAGAEAAGRSPLARLGGIVGTFGVLLLIGGAIGALIAMNYDTWVQGASVNSIGGTQQMAIAGMAAAAVAGAALVLIVRRRPHPA